MTENDVDGRGILLVGHGPMAGPLTRWAARHGVELRRLPVPAFELRPPGPSGRPAPPQVAERLAELDELEAFFERIAERLAGGDRVLGLAVPAALTASRSGRAWIDRVRAIAAGIARLQLAVWPVEPGGLPAFEPGAVRSAS